MKREEFIRQLEESAQLFKVYGSPLKENPAFEKHREDSRLSDNLRKDEK